MSLEVLIGRQPIYNTQLGVDAYELLFRGSGPTAADTATAHVVVNAFQEFGIEQLAGSRRVGINLSPQLFEIAHELPLPPQRVIFDIPPALGHPQHLPQLRRLAAMGYTLALDDGRYDPAHSELYALAHMVKLDIRAIAPERLSADMAALRRHDLQLLALRIETLAEFERFRDLGFDYFQGYFLSRPRVIRHGASLPPNKVALLRLFAIIHDPATETHEIERAIAADPILSYKLLRLINSAFFNLPRPVTALKDTILLLGRQRLATWCTLLALTQLSDKPSAVFVIALARARMCELLGEATSGIVAGDGFIVGLLSALDILLDRPLPQVISPLPLSEDIKRAILEHQGALGRYLEVVLNYELSQWRRVGRTDIPASLLTRARLDALDWADSVLKLTGSTPPPRLA
ncbi:EAL and HDOD domain-containing protein [Acidihalobacter prosperus]|uniref:HDOD domain-containing protein n=1 Tax=Acidihalobacter prosperus TaxID=160660 RepID=A0A1A6C100_9GAMM|nr:HDOD domain-containing protein [Acidihalobacter prosperus]OBS08242.1 hypothetical protein Thpro_022492 [Acidihalobacter prosperus]